MNSSETPLKTILKQAKKPFSYAALFSFSANIMMLGLPIYSLQVLDKVISSHSLETLLVLTVITVILFVFFSFFMTIRSFILSGISDWLDKKLAPELLSIAITRSSLGFKTNAGQLQRDLAIIRGFISSAVPSLLDAPWSLIFILVIYAINPVLGFLTVVGIIILVGFGIANEFSTRKPFEKANEFSTKGNIAADGASRNAEAIEAMGMMSAVTRSWEKLHGLASNEQSIGMDRSNVIQSTSRFFRMLIQILTTGLGAYLVLKNEMTVGGMIASSILVGRALAPFENAIAIWKNWIGARDSYHRLNKNIDSIEHVSRGNIDLPAPKGALTLENVIFTPPNSAPIIKGVSLSINAGEGLGIIGPSAAGKSTLAKLIMGILPTSHGAIRLDGAETFKWNRENFGQYVGYLPQHVDLFAGTIKDNIARLDENASMDKVLEAAMRAGVHDMILHLPKGYETECNEANLALSPGQRQRVGLARALYNNPRFVVLDEPNLNLDGEGEQALIAALYRLKQSGITYVIVAHRPTIVSSVDKLLVMRSGLVESFGPRDDVLKHYANKGQQPSQNPQKIQNGGRNE